jgi:polyisoprenoid-binding protein YceI
MNRPLRLVLPLFLLATIPADAGERVLRLDADTTRVEFLLDATGHNVEGSFALGQGEIRFDPQSGKASGEISITAAGAETGNKKRDKTMHTKVLESERYPAFVFRVTEIDGTVPEAGAADVKLHGTLSIHGAEHPMVLPAHVDVTGDRLQGTTEFAVPYVEWGMHDPSFLFLRVAKEVQIKVSIEGRLSPAEAEAHAAVR